MPDQKTNVYPVLLAGGTGTRLWPVSRELYPKQLVKFIGKDSLVQSTIKRLDPVLDPSKVRIVCGEEHFHETARHMLNIGIHPENKVICEPCGRNTAPAILLGIFNILEDEDDAIICVFPADHVIASVEKFHEKLKSAISLADAGNIVTFGIEPHYPETGYGYVEGDEAVSDGGLTIKRFVEKPDKKTAEKYVQSGNMFWNSGMFAFRASVMLEEFSKFQPQLYEEMKALDYRNSISKMDYEKLLNISIDYAIMEKTSKGVVLPSDFGWSDIGSWKSLYDFLPKDGDNNVIDGDVIAKQTKNCFIMGHERLIATNCIENMVVVETPDSVFVSNIDNSRDVKSIVENLKEKGRQEYHQHRRVNFPWGSSTVLDKGDDFRVDRLILYPDSGFQVETDEKTIKHLTVLKGVAKIKSGKNEKMMQSGGSAVISGKESKNLVNTGEGPLYIIMVETRMDS